MKKVNKVLRRFLGLWWIEPIEETLRERGIKPYEHVPTRPLKKLPDGNEPTITRID